MIVLAIFAFIAGVVIVLSPCILPVLPIILTSTIGSQHTYSRPLGVVAGFVLSFTFFTLFLSTIVRISGLPADALRTFSIVVIGLFGVSLLVPRVQVLLEQLFSKLSSRVPVGSQRPGFVGGLLIGVSLGLLWTPCVGPILASVISLALTGSVTLDAAIITMAYASGTAIPMFMIMVGGQKALTRVPWLVRNTANIQKAFGVIMILTAVGIYFNVDRSFQVYILEKFPSYGEGLTRFEQVPQVRDRLNDMKDSELVLIEEGVANPNPEFEGATGWVNSEPLTFSDKLKGKVVLVDFWTYTCINCIRTLPYLKAWYETYENDGFVIVGVHTPEFEFEKDTDNVRKAMQDFGLTYPVVQDNDYKIWQSYNNMYWPAHYLIDRQGKIRYTHFGEGKYDEAERMIRKLLEEGGSVDSEETGMLDLTPQTRRTPETYLGYGRIDRVANVGGIVEDAIQTYTAPPGLDTHYIAFGGQWLITREYAQSQKGSKLLLQYEGRDVFLVMRSVDPNKAVDVHVKLDGKVFSTGPDLQKGVVRVRDDRLYTIMQLPVGAIHDLELEFDGAVQVFAFTFG